ncbi:MAG: hypothetical protein ACOZDY_11560 [Pseudomonadota bacterium]
MKCRLRYGALAAAASLVFVSSSATFRLAGAMDAHPLVSEVPLERARSVTADSATTSAVLIAHGPNDECENRLWLRVPVCPAADAASEHRPLGRDSSERAVVRGLLLPN